MTMTTATTNEITSLTPGLYLDVPAAVYHALPAASNSRLTDLRRSPAHMREKVLNPQESTPALVFGEAVHFAVLQPDLFADRYAEAPDVDRRTTAGKTAWADFVAANAGRTALKAADWEAVRRIADSVRAHPDARDLLDARTATEASILWRDTATGQLCKARLDAVIANGVALGDLKTTRDASRDGFERAVFSYGYFRQAAMYMEAAASVGLAPEDFAFIAIEKEPPYAAQVYRIKDDVLAAGSEELRVLIARYAECERRQEWPGYGRAQDIGLPGYAWRQLITDAAE